ncbi:MAG: ATPase [Bacteroidales bacterium]
MILIADSGSSKTEWCLCGEHSIPTKIYTKGINPFYMSEKEISDSFGLDLLPQLENHQIDQIFFYGAGCSFPEKNRFIENAFKIYFPETIISVKSDLYAACHGLFGERKGVACILGTGSNSCFYDGKEIIANISPLGYVLGDEGSGAHLGKRLVSDMLKNQLPADLKKQFFDEFETSPQEILEQVYCKPFPNRYLANLSRFLINHVEEPECYDLIHDCFRDFFERNILQYDFIEEHPVNFVGSIAYHYRDILERVVSEFGLFTEQIEKTPMDGLIKYHRMHY